MKKNSSVGDGTEFIASIAGVQKEIDSEVQSAIGKLLVKEEDEDLTPDAKTYKIIASMLGGMTFFAFYVFVQLIRRLQWHFQSVQSNSISVMNEDE